MTGQPEPEDLTGYLEPDPPIGCLNLAADAAWTPPPPGSTREQLPDHLLALLDIPPYTSTACETAGLLSREMVKHTHRRIELGEHCDRLHERCRRNQKFTGALCACFCHDGQAAPEPAATEATDTRKGPAHPHPCTATIEGRATPGGRQIQCTREARHPENHVGPKQGANGKVLWNDHQTGATPHKQQP